MYNATLGSCVYAHLKPYSDRGGEIISCKTDALAHPHEVVYHNTIFAGVEVMSLAVLSAVIAHSGFRKPETRDKEIFILL
jgi:hypothetical protein